MSSLWIISKSAVVFANKYDCVFANNIYLCSIFESVKKIPGAVLWKECRSSTEEVLCVPINKKFYRLVCGLLANPQSYMHSGQNIAKIFTCVRYLTGLEKLPGTVLWNVGRNSNK